MSLFALDKWATCLRIIRTNGGVFSAFYKLWRMDTVKEGMYMGMDCFGNRYYENRNHMMGRSRWVDYNIKVRWDYDASQVTPEWFGWLHYKTDLVPCDDWAKYCLNCCCWCHCWLQPHEENFSGSDRAYYPYSTTPAVISTWDEPVITVDYNGRRLNKVMKKVYLLETSENVKQNITV